MGVTFDETLGESFYHDRLGGLVDELVKRGIARTSEGAVGVFLDDDPDAPPFLVQKKDGAFLYATTDLATIQYRIERWHPDAILYVVDHRQSLHFDQLFNTARRWLGLENVALRTSASARCWMTTAVPSRRAPAAPSVSRDCSMKLSNGRWQSSPPTMRPSPAARSCPTSSANKSPRSWASARSNTRIYRRTARAITSSATTRCWR